MTHKNCQTLSDKSPSDKSAQNSPTVETPFISSDSLDKGNTKDTGIKDLHLNGNGVKDGIDSVIALDDVTGSEDDVKVARDVDGGWAWVVLVASCFSMAIQEMLFSVVGMFQAEFQTTFGGSRGFLALIGSIFVTCSGMLAPVAGILSTQLTPRVTIMAGGALISLGMVSGSSVTSSTALLFTYGILGGLGNALVYTPAATAFSGYFVRLRQVANGLIMASAGLGSVLGPYLARYFIDWHGWRFSLAASGFLVAQVCVLGALIFPRSGVPRLRILCNTCSGRERKRERRKKGEEWREERENGGVTGSFLGEKCGSDGGGALGGERADENGGHGSFRTRVWKVMGKKEVLILCINEMLMMMGYNIQLLHQPSYIHSRGVDSRYFPDLFLAFGLSMMFIRVVGGIVFTRFDGHLIPAVFLSEMLMALALALLPLYGVTLPALFAFNILTGLSFGVAFMLAIPVLIQFIGVDLLPLAYGFMLLCCGSGSILTVSLAGFLYDILGTYKASFYLAGSLTGTGALTLLLLFCVRRQERETEEEQTPPDIVEAHCARTGPERYG